MCTYVVFCAIKMVSSNDKLRALSYANNIKDKYIAAIANDLDNKKDWISIYEIITRMLAGLK